MRLCVREHIPLLLFYLCMFFIFCCARSYVLGLRCDGRPIRMPLLARREASIWPVQTIEGPAEANYITGHSSVCLCDRDTTEPQMRRARPTQVRVT